MAKVYQSFHNQMVAMPMFINNYQHHVATLGDPIYIDCYLVMG